MARRPGSSRPSAAKSAQSSRSATGSNVERARQLHAVAAEGRDRERAAQGGRRVVGGVAELHGERRRPSRHHACGSRRGRTRGRERIGPGEQEPDRQRVGPRVLDPPLEHPDGQGAPLEVAGDDRRQLLADEAHAEDVGLERLPGPREQRVVRPAADRQGPAPRRQLGRPERGQDGRRRDAVRAADEQREAVGRDGLVTVAGRPRGASARRRRGTCARCSPCRARRSGRPANSPSSIIGRSTRACPTSAHGTPMPRRQATAGIAGQSTVRAVAAPSGAGLALDALTCRPR